MLMDGGSCRLQFVHDDSRFLGGDELGARSSAKLVDHLLVTLQVEGVLGFESGQLLIKIAGARQVARLDAGMGQEFDHFGEMSGFSGLVEQVQQLLEGSGIFAYVPDDGVQVLKN